MENVSYNREVAFAWGAALLGFVLAFMMWAGRDAMNFIFTWGPQALVLVVMHLLGARLAHRRRAGDRGHPHQSLVSVRGAYDLIHRKRSAFVITETDERLIASAASSGLSNHPVTG